MTPSAPFVTTPEVIVVGSGIAGLCAALTASSRGRVLLVTRGRVGDGCTEWAQGGMAAAVAPGDSPELHLRDTIEAGRGLCDLEAARVLVEEAASAIRRLEGWGVVFDRNPDGTPNLHQEAAHSRPRVLHARGDGTGREIASALARRVGDTNVAVLRGHAVTRLLLDDDGRCTGVETVDAGDRRIREWTAGAVILATGGAGRLFGHTTNPESVTGEGIALAQTAGAEIESCEFVQFHPTALALPGSAAFLISEALRGAGAIVTNRAGRRFLLEADPRGELAPRDVVARTIWQELAKTGEDSVLLDCRPVGGDVAIQFPAIAAHCAGHGIDIATTPIPVGPAAHYLIGGVRTDCQGATAVAGLYACGEVASTGVHGANRLASNSLLEGAVFGPRAARAALAHRAEIPPPVGGGERGTMEPDDGTAAASRRRLTTAMGRYCGIVRDARGLRRALSVVDEVEASPSPGIVGRSLQLATVTARCIAESALHRKESRGVHFRADHPETSSQWHGLTVMHTTRGATTHDRNFAADN